MARQGDELQYAAGEGPCLSALDEPLVVMDEHASERWPSFWRRWPAADAETAMSCSLRADGVPTAVRGSLNLYAKHPDAFDSEAAETALILAAHAAVAVAVAHERHAARTTEAGLREALEGRDVIGQAKGVLMVREGVGADEAFDILRRASQRLNVKLRQIAHSIAAGQPVTGPPVAVDAVPLSRALADIMEAGRRLAPDRLADLGLEVARASGALSVRIWLADYQQLVLLPFSDRAAEPV
jgi:hypothetical protein